MSLQPALRYPQHFSFSSLTKQGIPELQTGVTKFPSQAVPSQGFGLIRGFGAKNAELVQEWSRSYSGCARDKSLNCSLRVQRQPPSRADWHRGEDRTATWNLSSGMATFGEGWVSWEANSDQESPGQGLSHICSVWGGTWRSRTAGTMPGSVFGASEVAQVGLAFILAPLFPGKLLELTRARRVTDCQRVVLHIVEC